MERQEKMSRPDAALSDVVVDQDKAKGEQHHFQEWLLDYGKKITITMNLVIEITIIQTYIFKFENMMNLFSIPQLSNRN